jgi:hypothetical protein
LLLKSIRRGKDGGIRPSLACFSILYFLLRSMSYNQLSDLLSHNTFKEVCARYELVCTSMPNWYIQGQLLNELLDMFVTSTVPAIAEQLWKSSGVIRESYTNQKCFLHVLREDFNGYSVVSDLGCSLNGTCPRRVFCELKKQARVIRCSVRELFIEAGGVCNSDLTQGSLPTMAKVREAATMLGLAKNVLPAPRSLVDETTDSVEEEDAHEEDGMYERHIVAASFHVEVLIIIIITGRRFQANLPLAWETKC